jgi:fluoride exporter
MKTLLIFLAGGLGSVCRYGLSFVMPSRISKLPLATLTANVLGCFAIGVILSMFQKNEISESTKQILAIGFCGGFTTFSALSFETVLLNNTHNMWWAILYIIISIGAGIVATYLGLQLFK